MTDAELLAIVDADAASPPERRAHVEACAECGERLARLRADALLVREALAVLPASPLDATAMRRHLAARRAKTAKRSAWRNPLIQIAAAVGVAAVAAASVGPIRALIDRRDSGRVAPAPAPKRSAPPSVGPSQSVIAFGVAGPLLTLSFDSTPAAGILDVEPTTASVVSAEPVDAAADAPRDAMVVLPNELRLRNDASSRASYRVMVPRSVERVRVVVGGRVLLDGPPKRARIGLSDRIPR